MPNNARRSLVEDLSVVSVDSTSTVQIGDSGLLAPVSRVLSVQREQAIFRFGEFAAGNYSAFIRPVPIPAVTERLVMRRMQASPRIRIGSIRVLALSNAVIVQAGSSRELAAESRIKHIRHLFRNPPALAGKET